MPIKPPRSIALAAFFWASCAVQAASPASPAEVSFASGDGTTITAKLFLPADAPRLAVVALHGCGGLYATTGARRGQLNARHQAMAEMLVSQGYAVVFPDSLTPRGEREICTQKVDERRVTGAHRRADALAAMGWSMQQPWAQGRRLVLLGWSHGGSAVLSTIDGNRSEVSRAPVRPDLAITFYPGCAGFPVGRWKPVAPLVMMLGEKDDWTPPGPCVELGRSVDAQVHVFPDSHHDFDNPVGTVRHRPDVPNGLNPGQGVHAGPNPAARELAYARVRELLQALVSGSHGRRP